jgi:SAM-dependent methyltransferase
VLLNHRGRILTLNNLYLEEVFAMDKTENSEKSRRSGCCPTSPDEVKSSVREHYAKIVGSESKGSCCGQTVSTFEEAIKGKIAKMVGYSEEELTSIPEDAADNALGCGNPLAFADVKEGEVVLDIGSGAGIDVLLASKKVGKKGRVIGLDMTPEMIERGKRNVEEAGVDNIEFRLGEAESMPIEDETVDLIISNCVINLSPDKKKVFQEAYRVLKPGGSMLISDIVTNNLPQKIRDSMDAWVGCVAGALEEEDYLKAIRDAGFKDVEIVGKIAIDEGMVKGLISDSGSDSLTEEALSLAEGAGYRDGMVSSIKVRAFK